MRTSKRIAKQLLMSLLMLFALLGSTAFAAQIDTNASVSLTLNYHLDVTDPSVPVPGITFKLYRVADVSADCDFTFAGQFTRYNDDIDLGIGRTNTEWLDLATTLYTYTERDGIVPDDSQATDANGSLTFSNKTTGLYLIIGESVTWNRTIYTPTPFLMCLPNEGTDGEWVYDVTSKVKGDSRPIGPDDPDPTETPIPTNPPEPTSTPGPNDTPRPTNPPGPYDTPEPTNTPGPNDTPRPTNPPGPNDTPTPTNPPGPNDTPTPTNPPGPDDTPRPTNPPTPTLKPTDSTPSRPSRTTRTAIKVWNDGDNEHQVRPASIVVQLLRNGEVYDTATLDESNNWKHIWTGLSNGYEWTIAEEIVPENYTVSISRNITTFTITNTYHEPTDSDNTPKGTEPPDVVITPEPSGNEPNPTEPTNPNGPTTPDGPGNSDSTDNQGTPDDSSGPGFPSDQSIDTVVETTPGPFGNPPGNDRYQEGAEQNPTPKTGDENMLYLWLGLAVLFAAVAVWALYKSRNRREQR